MKKVSFDFDGTLQHPHVEEYAKELVARGIEVYITTTRYDDSHKHLYIGAGPDVNEEVWQAVERLGIPKERVHFTNMEYKSKYLRDKDFLWHLDDNPDEFEEMILDGCAHLFIHVNLIGWKEICEFILNK